MDLKKWLFKPSWFYFIAMELFTNKSQSFSKIKRFKDLQRIFKGPHCHTLLNIEG